MIAFADVQRAVEAAGMTLRGGFALDEYERVGPLKDARTVTLLGFVGASDWPAFAVSPEASDGAPHPLDRWSRRVVTALAGEFGAAALFPFDGPPYWPFQGWAQRAEPVFASPLGMLIHPRHGLWHSYRGALALPQALDLPPEPKAVSPCASCETKPCLSACPVNAFASGYDVAACAQHLRSAAGAPCLDQGCLARRACPVGVEHVQRPEAAHFHMAAFLAARV